MTTPALQALAQDVKEFAAKVKHRGWLGVSEVEVTLEDFRGDEVIVKAVKGHPFDMMSDDRRIPRGAKVSFHHDTYWYDAKIVPQSAVTVERLTP